jgi:cyclopropane fatty-acyl-phospholipid synthase-like methyltransferase
MIRCGGLGTDFKAGLVALRKGCKPGNHEKKRGKTSALAKSTVPHQIFSIAIFRARKILRPSARHEPDRSYISTRSSREDAIQIATIARNISSSKPDGKIPSYDSHKIMNEGFVQSMMNVDFGTYHHSTPEESKAIREYAEKAFTKLLRPLHPPRAALRILDAGCGLGFLTYVAAKCFPKASITGVDLFRHSSVSELSIDKAVKNMKSLRIESRTSFLKHDLTKPLKPDVQYDLSVSNLVFHNLGKKRFKAYGTAFDALKPGGYFVIGDLFPHGKGDMDYFRERSTLIEELHGGSHGRWDYKIKVLRKG